MSWMEDEIRSQGNVWRAILSMKLPRLEADYVYAHGTSRHAAMFFQNGKLVQADPKEMLKNASKKGNHLFISQSGETPDIVSAAIRADCGHGIVCQENSSLAKIVPTIVLPTGKEKAVPATKTYTATALAIMKMSKGSFMSQDLLFSAFDQLLASLSPISVAANSYWVLGQGLAYANAKEIALKLMECTGKMAIGQTMTGFLHGPVRASKDSLVILIVHTHDDLMRAKAVLDAGVQNVLAIGPQAHLLGVRHLPWYYAPYPLDNLLVAVQGQMLAFWAAKELGLDPDHPDGLSKITRAGL